MRSSARPMRRGPPLAVFDLDRTLLAGRTILDLADRFGVLPEVQAIWDRHRAQELAAGEEESRAIAALFAGVDEAALADACEDRPLRAGAEATVQGLRAMGFRVGVASATYTQATAAVARRLGLDFHVGARLVVEDGRLTGALAPSPASGACGQHVCKEAVLLTERDRTGASFTLAVGDGQNDLCMFQAADLAVAVEPCHPRLRAAAHAVVPELPDLLPIVAARLGRAA